MSRDQHNKTVNKVNLEENLEENQIKDSLLFASLGVVLVVVGVFAILMLNPGGLFFFAGIFGVALGVTFLGLAVSACLKVFRNASGYKAEEEKVPLLSPEKNNQSNNMKNNQSNNIAHYDEDSAIKTFSLGATSGVKTASIKDTNNEDIMDNDITSQSSIYTEKI